MNVENCSKEEESTGQVLRMEQCSKHNTKVCYISTLREGSEEILQTQEKRSRMPKVFIVLFKVDYV
jgi:hypothetical protein